MQKKQTNKQKKTTRTEKSYESILRKIRYRRSDGRTEEHS